MDEAAQGSRAGMPRWVKVFLVIAMVLVVAFVGTKLAGVRHGPGLHGPGQGETPSPEVSEHSPPIDHSP